MFHIKNKRIPTFNEAFKKEALTSLVLGADWLIQNQVRDEWPVWNANKGRFPYHVLIDDERRARKPMHLSTCWKTARGAMGLYAAYLATENKEYLESANLAIGYVMSLQYFEPGYEEFAGAFREDSPQGPHIMVRDSVIATQALITAYAITKEKIYLTRAEFGAEWLLKHYHSKYFPCWYVYPFKDLYVMTNTQVSYWLYAASMVFAQMHWLTGKKKFVREGAAPMLDHVIDSYIFDSGAFGLKQDGGIEKHHVSLEQKLDNVLSDDDGIGTALLATYKVTGREKYLNAAIGMGDFWLHEYREPEVYAGFPCIVNLLADLYRLTGDKKYLPIIEKLARTTINLQYVNVGEPILHGGFIGEDLAERYDKTSSPKDYVDLRVTSYALIALAKIAAENTSQWGSMYSCFGW